MKNEILYYINQENNYEKLYILKLIIKKMFCLNYNSNKHTKLFYSYIKIAAIIYIQKLIKYLYAYIHHCLNC